MNAAWPRGRGASHNDVNVNIEMMSWIGDIGMPVTPITFNPLIGIPLHIIIQDGKQLLQIADIISLSNIINGIIIGQCQWAVASVLTYH